MSTKTIHQPTDLRAGDTATIEGSRFKIEAPVTEAYFDTESGVVSIRLDLGQSMNVNVGPGCDAKFVSATREVPDKTEFHEWVEDFFTEAAPLDPSAVEAGDTVVVRFIETGEEFTTKAYQPADITASGEWVYILGWPLNKPGGKHGLALTKFEFLDHQPTPKPEPALPTTAGSVVLVRSMGGNAMALQLRPDRNRRPAWMHALGNPWIDLIVRDHLIEVLFDAGESR